MLSATTTGGMEAFFQKRRHSLGLVSSLPVSVSCPASRWRREPFRQTIQPIRKASTPSPATRRGVEMPDSSVPEGSFSIPPGSWAWREPARKKAASAVAARVRWREIGRFIFCERLKQAGTPFNHISPAVPIFRKSCGLPPQKGRHFREKCGRERFFCRKNLRWHHGHANFPPSSTGHTKTKVKGVLAQLVERFNGIEEVSGSNPLCSTK